MATINDYLLNNLKLGGSSSERTASILNSVLSQIEASNPNDTIFTPDVFDRTFADQMNRFGMWSGNEDPSDQLLKIAAQTGVPYDEQLVRQWQASPTGVWWNQEGQNLWNQSQQDDDGFLGMGDFGNILGIGGLALGGLGLAGIGPFSGLGGLFGGEAALAGADLGLFNAGVGGAGAIGGTGAAAGAGALGALDAGSNGMFLEDWISQIASNPGAALPEATNTVGGIANSLVTNGTGQFASSGLPWADALVDSVISGGGTAANATSILDLVKKAANLVPSGSNLMGSGGLAGLGALAGLLGGSKQAGTTTTVQDIPDWLKPYAYSLVGQGANTFAQTNQQNPLIPQSQAEMSKTIAGDYLNADTNPYLKGTVDRALGDVQTRVNAQFANNNFGSSGHQEWLGRNLAETALPIYNQNYQQERNRQFGATTAAPDFASSQTSNAFAPLNQYAGLLKGWGSQVSQPYFDNKLGNAFGGALTGYSLGQLFK